MFRELFRQAGPLFTTLWVISAAISLAGAGLVIYVLILLASYLTHHM